MAQPEPDRVTQLILRLGDGDPAVAEELLPLVYEELRGVAQRLFTREAHGHTLQPTALVHEAWLKLAGADQGWETRIPFFSVAAKAMRQVLTDHARGVRQWHSLVACRRENLELVQQLTAHLGMEG